MGALGWGPGCVREDIYDIIADLDGLNFLNVAVTGREESWNKIFAMFKRGDLNMAKVKQVNPLFYHELLVGEEYGR